MCLLSGPQSPRMYKSPDGLIPGFCDLQPQETSADQSQARLGAGAHGEGRGGTYRHQPGVTSLFKAPLEP